MSDLETVRIARVQAIPLRAKGGVSPNMALGQMPERPALLLKVEDDGGAIGWGEIWANFPPRAPIHKAHLVEDVIASKLEGFSYSDPREANQALRSTLETYFLHVGQLRVFEHLLAGIDLALWDLSLRVAGKSGAQFFGLGQAGRAKTYASSINPNDTVSMIDLHAGLGERFFKLKLGFGKQQDVEFVKDTVPHFPSGVRFGVDPNQMWDLETARQILDQISDCDPAFVEEPLPANRPIAEWETLAKSTKVPLAGGENFYGIDQFHRMINAGVAIVQPDVAKWGGLSGALDLFESLPEGVALWPHFMGTAVGQMAALTLSAMIGAESTCEMDVNANKLRTDLCGFVLTIEEGSVELPSAPGLVVPPSAEQLHSFQDGYKV